MGQILHGKGLCKKVFYFSVSNLFSEKYSTVFILLENKHVKDVCRLHVGLRHGSRL